MRGPGTSSSAKRGRGTARSVVEGAATASIFGLSESRGYCGKTVFSAVLVQNVEGVEPQHPDALRVQPSIAGDIANRPLRVVVRRSIHLDDQLGRRRMKVEDVSAKRRLSPKADAAEVVASQGLPQLNFGTRHFAARTARDGDGAGRSARVGIVPPAAPSTTLRVVSLPRFAEEDRP